MANSEDLYYLFDRYMQKKASGPEEQEFLKQLADPSNEAKLRQLSESYTKKIPGSVKLGKETSQAILEAVRTGAIRPQSNVRRMPAWNMRNIAAAVILIVAGVSGSIIAIKYNDPSSSKPASNTVAILPGTSGAILTLANGEQVVLDSAQSGLIAHQPGASVRLKNGQLDYNLVERNIVRNHSEEELAYNTISTPRGKQFKLMLPDGSKVWLNAASSLRYPTTFNGTQRKVDVIGEAYFEVASLPGKPFVVKVNNLTEVNVLGTSFNINAYTDEPVISTTVLDGSVSMVHNGTPLLLRPNESGVLQNGRLHSEKANMETELAWIHGIFNFKSANLQKVLRQISRWYDVDIKYAEDINHTFSGSVYRSENLMELFKIIEYTSNVKFTVEQKIVTVSTNKQ